MTERASVLFAVKEFGEGTPFLAVEPNGGHIELLTAGALCFDLPDGTTYEQAQKTADFMNSHIDGMAYTFLEG